MSRCYHPLALPGGLNGDDDCPPEYPDDMGEDDENDILVSTIPNSVLGKEETDAFPMLKKTKTKPKPLKIDTRPKLIHCGNHLIDPNDVVCITKTMKHKDLYIVKLRSNPNPEFPIWVTEENIAPLIQQFNVITE